MCCLYTLRQSCVYYKYCMLLFPFNWNKRIEFPVPPDGWYHTNYVENVMIKTANVIVVVFALLCFVAESLQHSFNMNHVCVDSELYISVACWSVHTGSSFVAFSDYFLQMVYFLTPPDCKRRLCFCYSAAHWPNSQNLTEKLKNSSFSCIPIEVF